jgi:hypothetical protein
MKLKLFILFSLLLFINRAQVIYNAYANVTNISGSTFTVNNVNETNHTFVNGEQVIVMQMQDDVIGTNTTNVSTFGNLGAIKSAGLWEIKTISSQTRTAGVLQNISFTGAFANTFTTGTNSSLQIITFRRLSAAAFTTTNNITGLAWNGFVGGVIAIEVGTTLTLNHRITANAIGFRGGTRSVDFYDGTTVCTAGPFTSSLNTTNAYKGEGIYKATNINFTTGNARILTGGGGGGMINSGGGGGGNFTAGGNGGLGWSCTAATSSKGFGGISLSASISGNRIFMGGGGGGGQQNNTAGTNGGNGGGIILVKATTLLTNTVCGSSIAISANGQTAVNSGNDGAGGGGAAGTIVLQITNYSLNAACPLTVSANAGNGGACTNGSQHAGGGGGAQGVIMYSNAQPTLNATTTTSNGIGGPDWSGGTTSAGSGSGANNSGIFSGTAPLPIELLNFEAENQDTKAALTWATASEKNTNYFYVERSTDATNWEKIIQVKAAENSNRTLYYETDDNEPIYGTSYYRLKIIDLDNSFSYSPIKSIYRTKKEAFVIFYPNPTIGILNLSSSYTSGEIKYKIFDVTGKELSVNITNQTNDKITFDFSNLAKGLYFINVTAPDGTEFSSNRIILK